MKNRSSLDVFVVSGFVASFFNGLVNPLYVSLVLSRLDSRVLAAGAFLASGLPVVVGALLGNRRVFRRLSAALPAVMLAELALAASAVLVAAVDVQAFYIASMLILGLASSSVVYLLQKVKERSHRTGRAAFDRRVEMADGLGIVAGSAAAVAALGALQTAVVYGLFLALRRTLPRRGPQREDEEPHPWRLSSRSGLTMPALLPAAC